MKGLRTTSKRRKLHAALLQEFLECRGGDAHGRVPRTSSAKHPNGTGGTPREVQNATPELPSALATLPCQVSGGSLFELLHGPAVPRSQLHVICQSHVIIGVRHSQSPEVKEERFSKY